MTQAANRLFFLLSLILILVIGGPVWAQSTEADIRYDQGLLAYRTGDVERARDIWLPLAEGGHPIAQYSLGKLYDIGGGAIKPSGSQAALWYRQAAVQGVAAAQNNLALMYAQGLADVPRDPAKAAKLWREAAEGSTTSAWRSSTATASAWTAGRRWTGSAAPAMRGWPTPSLSWGSSSARAWSSRKMTARRCAGIRWPPRRVTRAHATR
jgi:hypothetical protein